MGRLRRLGGWGSPGESLIGTLWEKRNELVCCSRGMGTRGNLTRRRSVGVSSFSAAPFRRSMRTGQMYMREMIAYVLTFRTSLGGPSRCASFWPCS